MTPLWRRPPIVQLVHGGAFQRIAVAKSVNRAPHGLEKATAPAEAKVRELRLPADQRRPQRPPPPRPDRHWKKSVSQPFVLPGDTLAVVKLDRLGRNTRDVLNLVHEPEQKGASLRVLEPGSRRLVGLGDEAMQLQP